MNKVDVINIMNNNPVFYLATVEDSLPRVRGMLLYKADETGLIFHTGTMKNLYDQLSKNPNVELCFNSKEGVQLRLSGEVVELKDDDLKKKIINHPSRGFLKLFEMGILKLEEFIVYRLPYNVARAWTIEKNFEPNEVIDLK